MKDFCKTGSNKTQGKGTKERIPSCPVCHDYGRTYLYYKN